MSPAHRSSILHHPKPTKVKEIRSFLGLAGYSRHLYPSYGELTAPLRAMVNEQGVRNLTATLIWTTVAHTVNGVLFQKKWGGILLYVSVTLDTTEDRHPPCTRHAAGVAKILQKTAHVVMGHPLTVLTTHSRECKHLH